MEMFCKHASILTFFVCFCSCELFLYYKVQFLDLSYQVQSNALIKNVHKKCTQVSRHFMIGEECK